MSDTSIATGRAASLIRHPPLLLYLLARSGSEFAYQIATVAIGWKIYALTGSAFDLGLAGLVQFLPSALLVFVVGHAADRYDRRRLAQICEIAQGLAAGYLAIRSFTGTPTVAEIFVVLALFGVASAFESPASSAMLTAVVPEGSVQRATALVSAAWQVAAISGPAIGGLVYAIAPAAPFVVMALAWFVAASCIGALHKPVAVERDSAMPTGLLAGFKFVWAMPPTSSASSRAAWWRRCSARCPQRCSVVSVPSRWRCSG